MENVVFKELFIDGLYEIKPFVFSDIRGSVVKEYDRCWFEDRGISFVPHESMIIESRKNVLRGVHFQFGDNQDKIVRCVEGKVWAVAVDLRIDSQTAGKWSYVDINDGLEVYVPKGCAFGTLALETSLILCMFGSLYNAELDSGIRWNDEEINIGWPLDLIDGDVILSEKDKSLMSYRDYLEKMRLQ